MSIFFVVVGFFVSLSLSRVFAVHIHLFHAERWLKLWLHFRNDFISIKMKWKLFNNIKYIKCVCVLWVYVVIFMYFESQLKKTDTTATAAHCICIREHTKYFRQSQYGMSNFIYAYINFRLALISYSKLDFTIFKHNHITNVAKKPTSCVSLSFASGKCERASMATTAENIINAVHQSLCQLQHHQYTSERLRTSTKSAMLITKRKWIDVGCHMLCYI